MTSRIIVLTGVTRGLGRAMTSGFVHAGHTVIGCGRATAALDELRAEYPHPHRISHLDVVDNEHVAQWAAEVVAEYGPPDLLINNAAVINRSAPLWDITAEEFSQVVDVNIKGVANVIRHYVPAMIERGTGVIVNFSSGWGRSTAGDVAPYCATKWAIEGLTQALAQELPAGMAAVPLNPGIIDTEMLRSCFGSSAGAYPNPSKWAKKAVPFLLGISPEDNGQPLTVG